MYTIVIERQKRKRGHSFFIISLTLFLPKEKKMKTREKKRKKKNENEWNQLAIFILPVVVTTTYMVDSHRKTHVMVVDDWAMVVVLMYLDIVVIYSNHSLMVESLVDHVLIVAIVIDSDVFVVDVAYDEVIEDLTRHFKKKTANMNWYLFIYSKFTFLLHQYWDYSSMMKIL